MTRGPLGLHSIVFTDAKPFPNHVSEPRPAGSGPATYLITFAYYGSHLHGDATGSVKWNQNIPGGALCEVDPKRVEAELRSLDQPPYTLDLHRREVVLATLRERCQYAHWKLLAAHVRTNHVHAVIQAEVRPETIMNSLKSYTSRRLNELLFDEPGRKRWARHGSTRWLWTPESVASAIRYVIHGQGEPMAVFEAVEGE